MRTGTRTTTAKKNHISGSLFTSLCGSLGFCFFALEIVNRKMIKCFSMKLNKYGESFCCYILVVFTTPKKVFSRSNLSKNSMQVVSSMHSAFQRAVIVFTIVLCRRRRRRRPRCVRSLMEGRRGGGEVNTINR